MRYPMAILNVVLLTFRQSISIHFESYVEFDVFKFKRYLNLLYFFAAERTPAKIIFGCYFLPLINFSGRKTLIFFLVFKTI